jgi:hypothetical protein
VKTGFGFMMKILALKRPDQVSWPQQAKWFD